MVDKPAVAGSAESEPALPDAVRQALDSREVHYDIQAMATAADSLEEHFHQLRKLGAAQAVLLRDSAGVVQVIIPANALLDIDQLNAQMQRNLQALPPEEIRHLQQIYSLTSLPAVPQALAGIVTMVDQSLLDSESVLLDSGSPSLLVRVKRGLLQQIGGSRMQFGNFVLPLHHVEVARRQRGSDEQCFSNAFEKFTGRRVEARIAETVELPPLSESAQRIIKLLADPEASIEKLAHIVEADPSLAAQVMSWARSPFYRTSAKVNSVEDAIVRVLGFDLVLNLALGLSLSRTLKLPEQTLNGYLPYWHQAIYVASLMEGLVRAIPARHRPNVGMAYLSGLLHNFGYLIMAAVFPPHFRTVCRYQEANPHLGHDEIEEYILQVNREQMASTLLQHWHLPDPICRALRFQNEPDYTGEYAVYANLLYVATRLLRSRERCDIPLEPVEQSLYERLHLDPDVAIEVRDAIVDAREHVDSMAAMVSKPH